jgi:hypothetical protein
MGRRSRPSPDCRVNRGNRADSGGTTVGSVTRPPSPQDSDTTAPGSPPDTSTALGIGYRIGPAATPAVARVLDVTGLDEALMAGPADDADTGTAG